MKRQRVEETMVQAAILQRERELSEKEKEAQMKADYAKHQTSPEEVEAARARYFARHPARRAK
jgi:hypothetical protein